MNTLFDKIWDKHVVQIVPDGPTQLYIDRLYCHEVTSPQAFAGMRARGLKMFRPDQIFCMLQRSACHSNCLRLRPTSQQRLASHHCFYD